MVQDPATGNFTVTCTNNTFEKNVSPLRVSIGDVCKPGSPHGVAGGAFYASASEYFGKSAGGLVIHEEALNACKA
jgi:hypothetical protein